MGLILGNVALAITGYGIWFERKFAGRMQNRPGQALSGLGASSALPMSSSWVLGRHRPACGQGPALAPRSRSSVRSAPTRVVPVLWHHHQIPIGILLRSSGSLAVFIWMAGWANNNKYALLGGMRSETSPRSPSPGTTVPIILADSFRVTDIVTAWVKLVCILAARTGPRRLALFFLCSLAGTASRSTFPRRSPSS